MKTEIIMWNFKKPTFLVTVFLIAAVSVISQAQEIKKWEISETFSPLPEVNIRLYETQTEIYPSKEDKIVVQMEYLAESDNPEIIKEIEEAVKKDLLVKNGNTFTITNHFFSLKKSRLFFGMSSRTVIEFSDSKKMYAEDLTFEIKKIRIYIPSAVELSIDNKYGGTELYFTIAGNLNLKLYDMSFTARGIEGNVKLDAKYSRMTFNDFQAVDASLYESRLKAGVTNQLTLDSKYSTIELVKSGTLNYTGYEDKLMVQNLPKAQLNCKYCQVTFNEVPQVEATMYEGHLNITKAEKLQLMSKYVGVELGSLKQLTLNEGYENRINIVNVDSLRSVQGKYNKFQIQQLNRFIELEGYEDDITIGKIPTGFSSLSFNGKYLDIRLVIDKAASYQLKGAVNYANFSINRNEYKTVLHDKENENLTFDYSYGKEEKPGKVIQLKGYEIDISLTHQ